MRFLGQKPDEAELQDMINEVDADNKGAINFNEFLSLMTRKIKGVTVKAELKEVFRVFDKDGNQKITPDELRKVLEFYLNVKMTDEELEKMMKEADDDDDCSIDFKEFEKMMMGY